MECGGCKHEMQFVTFQGVLNVFFCENCWVYDSVWIPCSHTNSVDVVVPFGDKGAVRVKKQCVDCGQLHGKLWGASGFDPRKLMPLNEELQLTLQDRRRAAHNEREFWLSEFRMKRKLNWFRDHNRYLQSDEWRKIRQSVLMRDGYLCQCCKVSKATEVHHLHYQTWRRESEDDLISLCRNCHEFVTDQTRMLKDMTK